MSNSANFNKAGFFNSVLPLNQTNWASYFAPSIPDGVIANIGNEMEVYGNSSGMYVYVKAGECRVRSHQGVLSEVITLDIAAADLTYDRIDLVVARVTYGNPSEMVVAVKTGTPAASPSCPSPTKNAGDVWEIPLAEVFVGAGVVTINADDVTDRRFVYMSESMAPVTFPGTSVTVENQRHYRNETAIDSLTINLPASPSDVWKCSVDFNASSSFSGITFYKGSTAITVYSDDDLKLKNTRYHLEIIWMGSNFWVIANTSDGKPIETFSSTSVTASSKREYRNSSEIGSLTVNLPNSPETDFITTICFSSNSSFTGVTFKKGTSSYNPKLQGAALTLKSYRYNLTIWWDGSYYWCNVEAA